MPDESHIASCMSCTGAIPSLSKFYRMDGGYSLNKITLAMRARRADLKHTSTSWPSVDEMKWLDYHYLCYV
ncbi:Os08g0518600 [Oryza sativa Japonica Group]|uniref:Os08g0518600 protein n=1 Tax=Oryza sativa subsp. japonica TaxID=39947 RepID=Q0J4E7_ORYSJ|nr:Os08g0518600 [Oryza sativa Japonica Group]|eukprot:NP_001062253.1 Os08g0518600 [Oryza sativa Japonica Group]